MFPQVLKDGECQTPDKEQEILGRGADQRDGHGKTAGDQKAGKKVEDNA